jgi:uncharacterized protein (DUF302 family)
VKGERIKGIWRLINGGYMMKVLRIFLVGLIIGYFLLTGVWSSHLRTPSQPMVVDSHNSFSETKDKLKGAIEARSLLVIFDANHRDIMAGVGIKGRNSTTIGFTGPMMEHKVLMAEPRAALEMPLKIVVRALDNGEVEIVYYQPSYLFSHYENKDLDKLSREMDTLVGSIVKEATRNNG